MIDPFRARWYRIKARDDFHCTQEGCEQEWKLSVARIDGKPFDMYAKADDAALTTRCRLHGGTGTRANGEPFQDLTK